MKSVKLFDLNIFALLINLLELKDIKTRDRMSLAPWAKINSIYVYSCTHRSGITRSADHNGHKSAVLCRQRFAAIRSCDQRVFCNFCRLVQTRICCIIHSMNWWTLKLIREENDSILQGRNEEMNICMESLNCRRRRSHKYYKSLCW